MTVGDGHQMESPEHIREILTCHMHVLSIYNYSQSTTCMSGIYQLHSTTATDYKNGGY